MLTVYARAQLGYSLHGNFRKVSDIAFRICAHEHVCCSDFDQVAQGTANDVNHGIVPKQVLAKWSCKANRFVMQRPKTSHS